MERDRILCNGLNCRLNVKAAFITKCLGMPELASNIFKSASFRSAQREEREVIEDIRSGLVAMMVKIDEKRKEEIYDEMFGKQADFEKRAWLEKECGELLDLIERQHQTELKINVLPYVTHALVRNDRCREKLESLAADCRQACIEAFRQSEYNSAGFLRKYRLDERKAARLAAGLLLLLQRGEDEERYRMVMDIIYAGYRSVKNAVKKLECLKEICCREFVHGRSCGEPALSRMVIQMVIAEDLGIPLVHDYEFCQVAWKLKGFEDERRNGREQEIDITEGKKHYKRLLREHQNPGVFYTSAFLEDDESMEFWEQMEELFYQFGIEISALYGLCLEKWESETLCAVFREEDWERYKCLLLIATLCKYIQQIESMYENDIPEEAQHRESCAEDLVKSMEAERKRMEQRIDSLEQQKKEKESALVEMERQMNRLKRELEKREERQGKDRAELEALKKLVIRQEEAPTWDKAEEKTLDPCRLSRSIVIGGHRNWQKKMRQRLPDSQFVAADHMQFDPAVLRNKKYIIVNTDIMKHGLFYKIMSEKKKGQKILYVHGNNVDRVIQEITKQL